jgi:pyruvate,water dikinase
MKWYERIKRLIGSGDREQPAEGELARLRAEFRTRYNHFQLLLTANNRTLEMMAEMQEALDGSKPIDMAFVRSRTTRIAANVYQIIRHLEKIAPAFSPALDDRFGYIKEQITLILRQRTTDKEGALILGLEDVDTSFRHKVGLKMAVLGSLQKIEGIRVPSGFVITAEAYRSFIVESGLQEEIDRLIQSADGEDRYGRMVVSSRIQDLILNATLPCEVANAVLSGIDKLEHRAGGRVVVAMRSSAIGEDEWDRSFAGMYRSVLDVTRENVLEAYKSVVAGKYNPQAMVYRLRTGTKDDEIAMCVGCMPMVRAQVGGVIYTQNPLDDSTSNMIIEAVRGRPSAVMEGRGADRFVVEVKADSGIVPSGSFRDRDCIVVDVKADCVSAPALNEKEIAALVRLASRLESLFQCPQDIEWAVDESGDIIVLQSRPLNKPWEEKDSTDTEVGEMRPNVTIRIEGGVLAARGSAAGPVCIVQSEADMPRFPNGAVLVVKRPLPVFAALFDRAKALISEQGGMAGHLAGVAREFHIPSVFGMKNAASILRENEIVTVDADHTRVYEGAIPELIERRKASPGIFVGSPVHRTLENVAAKILPLKMINADAPGFKAKNCETLHDITRFCHETSVSEMFAFGVDNPFPGRESRQLMTNVPMQYWLIDLGDGFIPEYNDKRYVRLSEIVSIPMIALWRGMAAVPWKGPPPINPRGFMEVVLGSAFNPSLVPGAPSEYSIKNYFMISKCFLSLQSRFGYHYATVEALVGERDLENYICFQFAGGAAGVDRRTRRAKMVEEILIQKGFRVERKQDALRARIERDERSTMEKHLAIVGYLLIHTRQLDMAMSDETARIHHMQAVMTALGELEKTEATIPT